MELFWQIAPLMALLMFAVVIVLRGLRRKPDSSANKARGGGSASHYKG